MKIIFGTTNKRKVQDLQNVINEMNLDMEVLSLEDIGFEDEIEENGKTIEENSLIKANAIELFCHSKGISYPIITDDTGLFVTALDGAPGIYTVRYADEEIAKDPSLTREYVITKLLNNLKDKEDRSAKYRCCVTTIIPDEGKFQNFGESKGTIAEEPVGEIKKPYFYTVFKLDGTDKTFNQLTEEELKDTYRYNALKDALGRINAFNKYKEYYQQELEKHGPKR